MCVCLCIVVSNTYCVVSLFCFSSCLRYVCVFVYSGNVNKTYKQLEETVKYRLRAHGFIPVLFWWDLCFLFCVLCSMLSLDCLFLITSLVIFIRLCLCLFCQVVVVYHIVNLCSLTSCFHYSCENVSTGIQHTSIFVLKDRTI
jgi:hypothetical protein